MVNITLYAVNWLAQEEMPNLVGWLSVVGIGVATVLAVLSVIDTGLYGGALTESTAACQTSCRERTGAVGIIGGVMGFLVGAATVIALAGPMFIESMAKFVPSMVTKLVLLVCLVVTICFFIGGWALMAYDINTFLGEVGSACSTPGVWSAALAFGLLATILCCVLFGILVAVMFAVLKANKEAMPSL